MFLRKTPWLTFKFKYENCLSLPSLLATHEKSLEIDHFTFPRFFQTLEEVRGVWTDGWTLEEKGSKMWASKKKKKENKTERKSQILLFYLLTFKEKQDLLLSTFWLESHLKPWQNLHNLIILLHLLLRRYIGVNPCIVL